MNRRLPSLNALKAFEAAARHQGFTAAAHELCVTHAAVSKQIRELEEWLRTPLFLRSGRGVLLTEAGHRLGLALTGPFDRMAEAVLEFSPRRRHLRLKVSVDAPMASRWLIRRLHRFTAAHPGIDLDIEPGSEFTDLRGSETDIAIRYGDGNWEDGEATLLSESWDFPVCSPLLAAGRPFQCPSEMSGYQLLHEHCKKWWLDWLAKVGVRGAEEWRGAILKHLAYEAAETGQGFALADYVVATDALLEGKLIRPFDFETRAEQSYFLVRAKSTKESATAAAFRKWLMGELQDTLTTFAALRTVNKAA